MASTIPAVMPKNQCSWKIALRKVMVRGRSGFRPAAQEVVVDPGELQQCGAVGIGLGPGLDRGVELEQIGRAACRERVCPYVYIPVVAVSLKKKNINSE